MNQRGLLHDGALELHELCFYEMLCSLWLPGEWFLWARSRPFWGVWLWAVLVRRDLMSIPDTLFSFCEKLRGTSSVWWPLARREARAMAKAVTLIIGDVGSPIAPIILVTDASGRTDWDYGGYGVVARPLPAECMKQS